MGIKTLAHFSPGRVIFFSLFITILLGTCALWLPIARTQPIALFDIFFTATSATCVTGIFTVPLDQFSTFGHGIILLLTQIGGLGIITLTIFVMSLFINFGLATQIKALKLLDLESWKNIQQLIIFIIALTLIVEAIGACCLFPIFYGQYTWPYACFLAIFHSVNSFCNAGITLFDGMPLYNTHYGMLFITIILMFIGSFGFLTWHDLSLYFSAKLYQRRHPLSLNTKIVIYSSLLLLIIGTLLLFMLERHHAFAHMSLPIALVNSLFNTVSARSTGLLSVTLGSFHIASVLCILIAGFIGAAPASTGSGVKITTFAIFISTIKAAIFGRTSVEMRGRSIANDQVYKAIAIVSLSVFWIVGTAFCLLIVESGFSFFDIVLETVSAFANIGLTTNASASFSLFGKLFIIASMIIGRIGSLTLVLALKELRARAESTEFSYPEERVVLS